MVSPLPCNFLQSEGVRCKGVSGFVAYRKTVQWTVFSGEGAAAPVLFVKQESPHIIYKCYKKEQNQPFFSFSFLKKESILSLYVLMPTLEGGTYD